jgi:hypothetical protein
LFATLGLPVNWLQVLSGQEFTVGDN